MATINLRNIPDNLKNQFKAVCDLANLNMTQAIINYMKQIVSGTLKEDNDMNIIEPNKDLLDSLLKKKPDEKLLNELLKNKKNPTTDDIVKTLKNIESDKK
jgi:antitoxin component of RelBE/YafQ-DinJ toxin-antitoxin module